MKNKVLPLVAYFTILLLAFSLAQKEYADACLEVVCQTLHMHLLFENEPNDLLPCSN
jgi:hypothetical protein